MKYIELTRGKTALVDDKDYERVSKYKWYAQKSSCNWYVISDSLLKRKGKRMRLHRLIMNAPDNLQVDHINGDGMDCRQANMRLCTNSQNAQNRKLSTNNTSGFKGVGRSKKGKKWIASIKLNGKKIHLGMFDNLRDAARAYDNAAEKYFGEFARFNLR